LLETIVVLAIAGLLLGLLIERGPLHSARAEFLKQKGQVLTLLRHAQLDAQLRGEPVSVGLDASHRALVERANGRLLARTSLGSDAVLVMSGGRAMGFRPDGSGEAARWLLRVGGHVATLSISPLTGRILIDEP